MNKLWRRLTYWFHRRQIQSELDEELEFHRAAKQAELEASGLATEDARHAAHVALGNLALAREDARGVWIWPWLESVWQDARNACRTLRRDPAFSLVVSLTLGLGVGLNATVFGMMDALLLRPFQFKDYDRIVILREVRQGSAERETLAPATFLAWKEQSRSFEGLSAWEGWTANLTGTGESERFQGARVSSGFFELVGVVPSLGRTFVPDEHEPGTDRRVILSDGLWKRRFAGDSAVVGRSLLLNGEPYTVIGVAPPDFEFPVPCDLWAPLALPPLRMADRERRTFVGLGKLTTNASLEEARAEMDVIGRRLSTQYPQWYRKRLPIVDPLSTAFREGVTIGLVGILQSGAGLVLLVACANLMGLLLARSIDRQRELAMRTALGAGRSRLVRQLVTETIVLALAGALVAVLFARLGLDVLRTSMPAEAARYTEGWHNLRLDTRVVLIIPAFAALVGLMVGLLPALSASRPAVNDVLKGGERGVTGGAGRPRARHALVVAEIAFALAVMIAAGLTLSSGVRLVTEPGGFDPSRLVTLDISVPDQTYADPASRRELARRLLTKLETSPGVDGAALSTIVPAAGWSPSTTFVMERRPTTDAAAIPQAGYQAVSARYFDTMRIPLVGGRSFAQQDDEDAQPVAIVSATLAKRFWPDRTPIGDRLRLGDSSEWRTIVGVAGDVTMYNWWDGIDHGRVYVPLLQAAPEGMVFAAVRTRSDAAGIGGSLREAIRSIDPLLPVQSVRSMEAAISASGQGLSSVAVLLAICGAIAAVLAAVGIYGLMAYSISVRTREFGVRIALGGTTRDMLKLALKQAGALTAIGLAIGFVMAVLFGRLLGNSLFGLVSLDLSTFLIVGVALGLVALASAYLPARRALRVDPATILRA